MADENAGTGAGGAGGEGTGAAGAGGAAGTGASEGAGAGAGAAGTQSAQGAAGTQGAGAGAASGGAASQGTQGTQAAAGTQAAQPGTQAAPGKSADVLAAEERATKAENDARDIRFERSIETAIAGKNLTLEIAKKMLAGETITKNADGSIKDAGKLFDDLLVKYPFMAGQADTTATGGARNGSVGDAVGAAYKQSGRKTSTGGVRI
jgi:hypothetical protein